MTNSWWIVQSLCIRYVKSNIFMQIWQAYLKNRICFITSDLIIYHTIWFRSIYQPNKNQLNFITYSHSATLSPSHISIIVTPLFFSILWLWKKTENASQVAVRRARHQTCSIWRIMPQEILVRGSLVKGSRSSGRLWSSQAPLPTWRWTAGIRPDQERSM